MHEFFSQSLPGIFRLTIPKESQQILLNLNLIVKPTVDGILLLGGEKSLLKDNWEPIHFHFSIQDSLFVNYTDLGNFIPGKSLIYLSNKNINQSGISGESGLSKEEFIDSKSLVSKKLGEILLNGLSVEDQYTLTDELGNVQQINANSQLQNTPFKEGLFAISGKDLDETFYFFPQRIFRTPDLIFTIYPAVLNEQIKEKETVDFVVKFKSRMTKWRYILTDPIYSKFQNLNIVDSKQKTMPFEEKEFQLSGIGNVRCFESRESIMLQDINAGYYQLVAHSDQDPINQKIIIKNLPKASPDQLFQETFPNGDLYSHIFI